MAAATTVKEREEEAAVNMMARGAEVMEADKPNSPRRTSLPRSCLRFPYCTSLTGNKGRIR